MRAGVLDARAGQQEKEVALTLSIGQRERGDYKCPGCGGTKLQPLMGTFFSKTSRKA